MTKFRNVPKLIVVSYLTISFVVMLPLLNFGANKKVLPPPNILWLVSEDNSPFLGCYGDNFATTPNLDHLAAQGIRFNNAFATAPVCAPARSTLITGMYPSSMGTENMRSWYVVPNFIKLFPAYLKQAGYYTTNNKKTDYNLLPLTHRILEAWDESSENATYKNRSANQPFFAVFNTEISHERFIHTPLKTLQHNPKQAPIPLYHPRTPEMEHDWAQYYDKITEMDTWVGQKLAELEEAGLAENTIVFYYSDHGGVLGRSKRYLYESGLKVPLIVRVPKKYQHLINVPATSISNDMVSFVDFAPTILKLAGVPIPSYMQGQPFLGNKLSAAKTYAVATRGRMDERLDLSRTIRDKKYRYVRNYMPHKIYGQYLAYLWKAPSMSSWENQYKQGLLNKVQATFWQKKPFEELYDIEADPHNINNLAANTVYANVLKKLSVELDEWMLKYRDAGFIPEGMITTITKKSIYDFAQSSAYPLKEILVIANIAAAANKSNLDVLINNMSSENQIIRYWAAMGCRILQKDAFKAKQKLINLLNDKSVCVQIVAAEALYYLDEPAKSLNTLKKALKNKNRMVRLQALNVLSDIGAHALPIKNEILKLTLNNPAEAQYDAIAANHIINNLN